MALLSYFVCLMMIVLGSLIVRRFVAAGVLLIIFGSLALITLITLKILLNFTPEGRAVKGVLTAADVAQSILSGNTQ